MLFLVATGHGRESAPAVALIVSLFALPATMLANCWVLFVAWSDRTLLFAAGLAVPCYVGCGMAIFVHGAPNDENVGLLMLAPFFMIPSEVTRHPLAVLAVWLLGMIALILRARALAYKDDATL
jgi:hypothetical protein